MRVSRFLFVASLLCLELLPHGEGWAQATTSQDPYKPTVGQAGKDAVWVPTSEAMVEKMLDHAGVTSKDFVVDLGSGDGRMIIAAAKRGARGRGVEYNPELVAYSKRRAVEAGVADKAIFVQGDMYQADISDATVLALFLLPANVEKLLPKFLELPPGTRIVANTLWVNDWAPDDTQTQEQGCDNWCTSKLFIIPARVEGKWRLQKTDGVLSLTQRYQMIEGTYTPPSGPPLALTGRLRGRDVTLTIDSAAYRGAVNGDRIDGTDSGAANAEKLFATRIR